MSRQTFRDDVRDLYERETLPPQTLERLVSMTEAVDTRRTSRSARTAWLIAAMALVALSAFLLRGVVLGPTRSTSGAIASVADEIALNHFKAKEVDFVGDSVVALQARMTGLDFTLADVAPLLGPDVRLVGGRYCSIQGVPAAQLRLETSSGRAVTVYQARMVDALADLPRGSIPHPELQIELLRVGDVLVGMARAP